MRTAILALIGIGVCVLSPVSEPFIRRPMRKTSTGRRSMRRSAARPPSRTTFTGTASRARTSRRRDGQA